MMAADLSFKRGQKSIVDKALAGGSLNESESKQLTQNLTMWLKRNGYPPEDIGLIILNLGIKRDRKQPRLRPSDTVVGGSTPALAK